MNTRVGRDIGIAGFFLVLFRLISIFFFAFACFILFFIQSQTSLFMLQAPLSGGWTRYVYPTLTLSCHIHAGDLLTPYHSCAISTMNNCCTEFLLNLNVKIYRKVTKDEGNIFTIYFY